MPRCSTLRKFLTCVALGTICFVIFTACGDGSASTFSIPTATPCHATTPASCPPTPTLPPPCLTTPLNDTSAEVFITMVCRMTGHVYGFDIIVDDTGRIQQITGFDCPSVQSSEGDCTPLDNLAPDADAAGGGIFKDKKTGYGVFLVVSLKGLASDGTAENNLTLYELPPGGAPTTPTP